MFPTKRPACCIKMVESFLIEGIDKDSAKSSQRNINVLQQISKAWIYVHKFLMITRDLPGHKNYNSRSEWCSRNSLEFKMDESKSVSIQSRQMPLKNLNHLNIIRENSSITELQQKSKDFFQYRKAKNFSENRFYLKLHPKPTHFSSIVN